MSELLDISMYDNAEVLACLYNNASPQGLGMLHYNPTPMSVPEAADLLREQSYFDYLHGRVMKVDLSTDLLDPRLYDRDNGDGAAQMALSEITRF